MKEWSCLILAGCFLSGCPETLPAEDSSVPPGRDASLGDGGPTPSDAASIDAASPDAASIDAASRDAASPDAGPREDAGMLAGFTLSGDPTSASGATWTYRADSSGVSYNLAGVLLVPEGMPPSTEGFPAVLLSHATGGSATSVAVNHGQRMRGWGMVAISVNYTHANAEIVPDESPGTFGTALGASDANIARARKCIDILEFLGNVDMARVAGHGHSRGALVTGGFAGEYPTLLRVASHTAGGVDDSRIDDGFISSARAREITIPYQLHHGTDDPAVPLATGQRLADILDGNGVTHELWLYEGRDHNIASLPMVLSRIQTWYRAHGVL